jgi:hypothetical protein
MDATQRRTIALALWAIALVLFVFFFGRQAWEWATWNDQKNTLDLGFLKVSARPPFPNDAKSVLVGLVLPIVLAAGARLSGRVRAG